MRKTMKILVADKVSDELIAKLTSLGADVVYKPDLNADTLPEAIGSAMVLIVRSTKVTQETIAAGRHLDLIIRAGSGVNTIDIDAASSQGIYVSNCPGMNTDAVAELVIGLLISVDRDITNATHALRCGQWQKKRFSKGKGLKGRTLGIVGTGKIGLAVIKRAKAFDMHILAWSRSLTPERAEELDIEYADSLTELAQKSDAVTVHLASNKDTKKLLDREFFAALKPGAIFLNASRGDIIDQEALKEAISAKGLRVGLDVFENEPSGSEAPFEQGALASLVTCTPHIGASTDQASEAIANEVFNIVQSFVKTGSPTNVVNLREPVIDQTKMIIKHFNHVGVLARVLTKLRDEDINIEEMLNAIFQTDQAACCTLFLDKLPSDELIRALNADKDIIEVTL